VLTVLGCFGIEERTDIEKLTNVITAAFGGSLNLVGKSEVFVEDEDDLTITGPPTHSVGGQYCFALWRLSSSVTLHSGL